MTNIYNKGRYRNGEWAKHLRPYLKKMGNHRWRRTARGLENIDFDGSDRDIVQTKREKDIKSIQVKFKMRSIGDWTYSYTAKYRSIRSAKDAMNRRHVIHSRIIN
jgi:hypothetical protein